MQELHSVIQLLWIGFVQSVLLFFISLALASKGEVAIVNSCVYNKSVCILYTCQVSSIDTVLALGARGCEFESRQCQCSHEN